MLNKRPKIGITGPDKGGRIAWIFTATSVYLSGGSPVRITPSRAVSLKDLQGLILGGGADIDPERYGDAEAILNYAQQSNDNTQASQIQMMRAYFRRLYHPFLFFLRRKYSNKVHRLDKRRDLLEFSLLDEAIRQSIPVLGICRGAQLINVYFKGNLHPEIKTFYSQELNMESRLPVKKVFIKPESKLAAILKTDRLQVNALHHQAVKEPGQGIKIVASEPNGVVQAIESGMHEFVIGVQWHPEYLVPQKTHRSIFKALVEKAKAA